jgi:hypothetical protein
MMVFHYRFLPHYVVSRPQEAAHLGSKFAQILELYVNYLENCVNK